MSAFSLEMIDHQPIDFFEELTEVLSIRKKEIIDTPPMKNDPTRDAFGKVLEAMIYKRFGFWLKCVFSPKDDYSFGGTGVVLSYIDTQSLIRATRIDTLGDFWYNKLKHPQNIAYKIIKGEIENPVFEINRKKAKVKGKLFEQNLMGTLYLPEHEMATYDPEEMAAIICHEIGHVWGDIEYLGMRTMLNITIANSVKEILNVKDEKSKMKVIADVKNMWNIPVKETDLVKMGDNEIITIVTGGAMDNINTEFEKSNYHLTNFEAIADQFATRMGGGKYNVTSMSGKYYYSRNEMNNKKLKEMATSGGLALISTIIAPAAPAFAVLAVIATASTLLNINEKRKSDMDYLNNRNGETGYDVTKERFKRIYNDMVNSLKQSNISQQDRTRILNDINAVKAIIDKTPDYNPVLAKVVRIFSKTFKAEEKKRELQQLTEELLNNELYVSSEKLKQLQLN